MKKKVFSLMMTLLLAVTGVVRAGEITVHDGTTTNAYIPVWGLWTDNSLQHEFVYPADELVAMNGGEVTTLKFYTSSSYANVSWNGSFQVFMKEVGSSTITSFLGTSDATLVYEGTLGVASQEMEIALATPYTYNGGNLWVGVYYTATTGYSSCYWVGENVSGAAVYARSGNNYSVNTANFLPKTTFTYNGGGVPVGDKLHVKYMDGGVEVVDALDLGARPAGAWMEPFSFTMYSDGPAYTVNVLDFTPSDGLFTVAGEELPFQVTGNSEVALDMVCNGTEAGVIERQFVAITEGDRAAHVWPVTVELYAPEVPDVWERACTEATAFPFVEVPGMAHHITLHNDYTLPFPEIPEGVDAVYKLVFTEDQMLNASVTYGADGKVALYREGFEGEGGPMATNNYVGIMGGGSGPAVGPFEVQIGDGTSTSGYMPFYCYYNYSMSQQLFLAAELEGAGVTGAPMTSLSWYCTSTNDNLQSNITIWMANVDDTSIGSSSTVTGSMAKVYEGNMTPVANQWNEFVFNQGTFAWDGHSNVLISVQRNNGAWASGVNWQVGAQSFTASGYSYNDSAGAYNMATTSYLFGSSGSSYGGTTTNRANIILKADGRNRDEVLFADGFEAGNLNNWTLVDSDNDGEDWLIGNPEEAGIGYAHTGTYCASSWSWNGYTYEPGPDNWMISPEVVGATSVSYYVSTNTGYPDHYAVLASTSGTAISNFVTVFEEDAYRGGNRSGVRSSMTSPGTRAMSEWAAKNITLPAGTKYVAFRHYNSYDNNYLFLDDVTIYGNGGGTPPTPPTPPTPTPSDAMSYGPVIENAAVEPGTYYLVASSTTPNFEVTINAEAMPCPTIEGFAFNPVPADDADGVEPASVTLQWMIPDYATGWRLIFGTTYHPEPNHPQTIMYPEDGSFATSLANSFTVRNLWNNTNYFWRVEFNNDGCPEGVSSPIWGFTTHLNVPQNLTAVDQTVFDDETIVLNWNAVVDRTYRQYNVYRDGVLIGHTQVNNIGNTTYTDGPLDYNMAGYTYYVTAVYDEGESAPSNTVDVKVSGYGDVNGHVYEQDGTTGIAGATVTMVGQDEFGVNHTYNFQTNGQGYYSGHIYAGSYNGQAAKDGYQTITAPVQGNPIAVDYNNTTSPVDYILDENFDPVCTVIAEYYPDSLDPQAPYVKVYWGCGLPGEEIIEDFETGDFSKFDWQVDNNYPWSVTTYNPYEGTYCMKSGGAGVNNVVSNMTVTVNIPADGEMSFFGKISSENNWDYGYFYIDNQQMGSYTGAGNWAERKFPITAGDHTFQWRYTKDGSVNSNDDCFYVDYITFYRRPEPVQPGWVFYDDGVNVDAIGLTAGGSFYWGVMFPAGSYAGNSVTKVSMYDYSAHTGNIMVYQGGATAPGTLLYTQAYTCTGSEDFVEWTLNAPVTIDPAQNLWIVMNNDNGQYVASACANTGNPNGRWISLDGATWEDVADYGLDYTWMIRAYVADGAKGAYVAPKGLTTALASAKASVRVKGETRNAGVFAASGANTTHNVGVPAIAANGNRALSHYRVYRTNCYNDGPYTEENTVLLATVWMPDTVYIDVEWSELPAGVYKWGVGTVYEGNRGEMVEGPINWAAPVAVNKPETSLGTLAMAVTPDAVNHVGNGNGMNNRDNWLYYDDGVYDNAIGASGTAFYWGIMFPASDMAAYDGQVVSKVSQYFNDAASGDIEIYQGGTDAPASLVYTQPFSTSTIDEFVEFNLNTPVTINGSQSLWIVMHATSYSGYPASVSTWQGDDNGSWISIDGSEWLDLYSALGGQGDGTWMLRAFVETAGGPTPPTPPTPGSNGLQLPRESEIVWSNCLEKDMWLENALDITVLLNSADSPEGVTVSFENQNEAEQELYPMASVVLDGTGYYSWDTFRKGDYQVSVTLEGYEPIVENVSIWEPTSLRYVMIEIIYGVSDLYVSRTGWAMWEGHGSVTPPTPPTPPTPGTEVLNESFEGTSGQALPAGWTSIDADGDGNDWYTLNWIDAGWDETGAHTGDSWATSASYNGSVLHPDNYLVSPQVTLGGTLTFWASAQDPSWAAEHFGVAVSTTTNNNASAFTTIQEWTMTAKGLGAKTPDTRGGGNRIGAYYEYTVDLGAYAGQTGYVAIRHFNCSDMFRLNVDDIVLTDGGAKSGERHLEYYKVLCESIDHEPIFNANTVNPFYQLATDDLVEGEQYICKVAAVYSTGMSDYAECVWQYESCSHYAGTVNGVTVDGNTVTWDYPGGGPTPPPAPGENEFTEGFEGGLNGWTVLNAAGSEGEWIHSNNNLGGYDYTTLAHGGTGFAMCYSFVDYVGAFNTDSYLITPQKYGIVNGSTLTFWADNANDSYPENFSVCVATADNPTAADFTQVWSGGAKGKGGQKAGVRHDGNRYENWRSHSIDLSAYAGQNVYIAFHDVNYDMYEIWIDDVALTAGAKGDRAGDWYYYDNGVNADAIGLTQGGSFYWGVMFPAGSYQGNTVTKVSMYDYSAHTGNILIYQGGTTAPGTLVGQQAYTCTGVEDFVEWTLSNPVTIDPTQNLWIVMNNNNGQYVASCCDNTGSANGRWISLDGAEWMDLYNDAGLPYTWMIRAYVEDGAGPVPPVPSGDILGAMIFVDGEWEAFVPVPTNTYTYEGEGNELCVRVVYNGTAELPSNNFYYAMSCEECVEVNPVGPGTCEMPYDIHAEQLNEGRSIKVWWGAEPAAPISEWLYYFDQNATEISSIGTGSAADVYWGIMVPADMLTPYVGTSLTKMAMYQIADYNSNAVTVNIFLGGSNAPQTLVSTMSYTPSVFDDFEEVTLTTAVPVDGTQNLWITVKQNGTYPALGVATTGNANARWISLDGSSWEDVASYNLNYDWLIMGFVTNQGKGGELTPIEFTPGVAPAGFTLGQAEMVSAPVDLSFKSRSSIVKYNVYRSTDAAAGYTMIGEVAEDGSGYYEYIDTPVDGGTYYYQVRAYYDNDCESEPAMAADDPTHNYVSGSTVGDGLDENGAKVALYPNPTNGNVTIEAAGMSRITVVSVLGQVVFDTELNADNYILNMGQFNAGLYLVRVYTESGVTVKRVTVMQ